MKNGEIIKSLLKLGLPMTLVIALSLSSEGKTRKVQPQQVREDYIARIQQQTAPAQQSRTLGSIWSPDGMLVDLGTDYKAKRLNDIIVIQVYEQTSAQSSGNVSSQRDTSTQSAITGLAAQLSTKGVNPILAAQSSNTLKGQGQAATASTLRTTLSGQVISILPNGNLVVEAEHRITMNNQHETVIVRGVVRPGDVAPNNAVASTSLMNLEIELKGKGVISDATHPPNALVRAIQWLIGF